MGGVGKTTLARLLYHDQQVKEHFELKAWVCVSDEFDSFGISKVIFKAVAGLNKEFADLNLLQEDLVNHLRGKRFLLILDDVWTESYEDWKTLVGPFHACASGSKIIITTRKDQLLKQLVHNPINKPLYSLSNDDALSLVAQNALGVTNFDSHLSLKPFAQSIAQKCGGLPLALIALGRLLRTKKDEVEYWKEVSNSEIWRLKDEGGILPALRLSYQDLSATLKQLFAYCSLFPKDFLFDKEELVLLWMAEGFLHQPTPINSTEEHLGYLFFDELLSRSFFQHAPNNESSFVMHDLMNDLATSVATEFFLTLAIEDEKNIKKEMLEKYRHMSFVREEYLAYKKFQPFTKAKNLRTFLAMSVGEVESLRFFYLSNKILTNLLPALPLLRVLSLSRFEISEVPESIGDLKHLRYLNLSKTSITCLPENICNLYNLQSLILFGCNKLTKLPKGFLQLKNLRHLDVRDTPLLFQMLLEIGKLKSLQINLSKIIIGSESGIEIAKLKEFNNLHGKFSIIGLGKVQNANYAREANFSRKRLMELELVWSEELTDSRNEMLEKEVLNELKPCQDALIQLYVRSYGGLEFLKWVGDPSFLHLKHVSISGCKRCTHLPPLAQLPSLKELFIEAMPGWKKWSGGVLPSLNVLMIKDCPNLVEVTLEGLPSLNVLYIAGSDSGVLGRLVEIASPVIKLEISCISGLNDGAWRGVIEYLGAVEELIIERCNEIKYLVKSDSVASKVLMKLRKLEIWECDNLMRLGEKEEDNCRSSLLTSLRILKVCYCKNMECCSCPDGIEELIVSNCSSITVVSFPKGGQEKLRSLTIRNCKKLLERKLGGQKTNNTSKNIMPMLEYVEISDWPNLKSIIQLNCFLTKLQIMNCESLESCPDNMTSLKNLEIRNCPKLDGSFIRDNLTSLTALVIYNCPSMDASFRGWVWPPNLRSLHVGRLKKPILAWGPQNFPASLVELWLYGSGEYGVTSSSQFAHLLPSSLTSLEIFGFEELKSFSTGIIHLTSLQRLSFYTCPNLMDLPEMLLPSLLTLYMASCPNMVEKCSKNGSYWPLISHIPYFHVY